MSRIFNVRIKLSASCPHYCGLVYSRTSFNVTPQKTDSSMNVLVPMVSVVPEIVI